MYQRNKSDNVRQIMHLHRSKDLFNLGFEIVVNMRLYIRRFCCGLGSAQVLLLV